MFGCVNLFITVYTFLKYIDSFIPYNMYEGSTKIHNASQYGVHYWVCILLYAIHYDCYSCM